MNYLAHIYLSADNPQLQIGNFIADFIKANKYTHLPQTIQEGVFLHRHIDTFTDAHPVVKQSKNRLDKRYGHYRGIVIDIFYDHFLAKNWHQYNNTSLSEYTTQFYKTLETHKDILPEKVNQLLSYLVKDNWLLNYAHLEGIERTLIGMNRRTQKKAKMHLAINDLKLHYTDFECDFTAFFENLCTFSADKIKDIKIK